MDEKAHLPAEKAEADTAPGDYDHGLEHVQYYDSGDYCDLGLAKYDLGLDLDLGLAQYDLGPAKYHPGDDYDFGFVHAASGACDARAEQQLRGASELCRGGRCDGLRGAPGGVPVGQLRAQESHRQLEHLRHPATQISTLEAGETSAEKAHPLRRRGRRTADQDGQSGLGLGLLLAELLLEPGLQRRRRTSHGRRRQLRSGVAQYLAGPRHYTVQKTASVHLY